MVKHGNHSLQLVDATTGAVLPEYTDKNGETWVAGAPGDEYYVRITSHTHGSLTTAQPILVDGRCIGYSFQQGPDINMCSDLGPVHSFQERASKVKTEGGSATTSSFKFASTPSAGAASFCGEISVTYNSVRDSQTPANFAFATPWQNNYNVQASDSTKDGVGALNSTVGSSSKSIAKAVTSWICEAHLYTIKIKYCEEIGLLARKIITPQQMNQGVVVVGGGIGGGGGGGDPSGSAVKKSKKKRKLNAPASGVVDLTGSEDYVYKQDTGSSSSSSSSSSSFSSSSSPSSSVSGDVVDLTEDGGTKKEKNVAASDMTRHVEMEGRRGRKRRKIKA